MGDVPNATPDAAGATVWDGRQDPGAHAEAAAGAQPGAAATAVAAGYHDGAMSAMAGSHCAGVVPALKPDSGPAGHAGADGQVRSVASAGAAQPEALGAAADAVAGRPAAKDTPARAGEGLAAVEAQTDVAEAATGGAIGPGAEGGSDALAVLSAIAGSFSEAVRFADLQAAEAAAPGAGGGSGEGEALGFSSEGAGGSAAAKGDGGPVTSGDGGGGLEGSGTRSRRRNVLNELHAEAQALETAIRRMQGLCTSSSYSGFRVLLEETPEFPAALSQALQQLAHYSSRVRTILVSNPVDFRVAAEACNECIVTYCRIHQLRSRVFSQSHARSLLTGGHISSTHPALQAIVGDMPLSQWMSSFLSTDGATLAQQPFENCRELLARWRMHERQLEEQLEALQAAMRSTATENVSTLLQHSLQLAPDPEGNSVVILRRDAGAPAEGPQGLPEGGGGAAAHSRGPPAAVPIAHGGDAATPGGPAAVPGGAGPAGAGGVADMYSHMTQAPAMPAQHKPSGAPAHLPKQPLNAALLAQCVQALRQNEEFRSVALQQLQALLPAEDMLRFLAVRFEIEDACKHLVQHVEPQAPSAAFLGSSAPAATGGATAVNLTQAKPGGPWPKPPPG